MYSSSLLKCIFFYFNILLFNHKGFKYRVLLANFPLMTMKWCVFITWNSRLSIHIHSSFFRLLQIFSQIKSWCCEKENLAWCNFIPTLSQQSLISRQMLESCRKEKEREKERKKKKIGKTWNDRTLTQSLEMSSKDVKSSENPSED